MESLAERLRDARLKAGYVTGSDAARAFGWPVSTYLGHENGDRTPGFKTLEKYGQAFSVDYLWLLNGKFYREPSQLSRVQRERDVPLVGLVRSDGSVDPNLSEIYGHSKVTIKIPIHTPHELVAVEVSGQYGPKYDVGDIIICRIGYDDPATFEGKYCLLETEDGSWFLGKVLSGKSKGRYKINVFADTVADDVSPIQIGAIYMILPGAQVSPPRGFVERVRTFGEPREPPDLIDPSRLRRD